MSTNPYVRTELAATRHGVPDPRIEVECWLEALEEQIAVCEPPGADPPAAGDCYDLLAAWCRLRRVRPELLAELGGDPLLARAEQIVERRGRTLAERALAVPNPGAWLDQARQSEAAADELGDPARDHQQAAELLADLDDAELVQAAARRLGLDDPQLDADLDPCRQWLFENADLLLAASVTVQAVGLALRPDLEQEDGDLAATAVKYAVLLDEAERAERELALADVRPLPVEVVRALYARFCEEQARAARAAQQLAVTLAAAWLNRRLSRFRPVLSTASTDEEVDVQSWIWNDPDGRYYARLVVPDPAVCGPSEPLVLAFLRRSDDTEASELRDQPVWLGQFEATIDASGSVVASLGEIVGRCSDIALQVGPDRRLWPLDESSLSVDTESSE